MKIDPYNNKRKFLNWKGKGCIEGITQANSKLIIDYLTDMESGLYVSRKGMLSYVRLNSLRHRMGFITRELERLYENKRIVDLTQKEIISFFKKMREGDIKKRNGGRYTSIPDYVKVFKAFFHWYQRSEADKGNTQIKDITTYIDTSPVKESSFVYITIDDLRRLADDAKFKYKALLWFLFDSGIRAPTELMNIKLSDLSPLENSSNFQLHIRDEISKTFGRKIKLLLCSDLLRRYINEQEIKDDDYLFPICPAVVNKYLKRLAVRVLGDHKTKGGKYTRELTMYDLRHASVCYFISRYPTENGLKYRMGWKKSSMVFYYSKFLGLNDNLCEDDLLVDAEAKTQLEKNLEQKTQTNQLLKEQLEIQQKEMQEIRSQLHKNQSRDEVLSKVFLGLSKHGKLNEVVDVVKELGLTEDVLRLTTPEQITSRNSNEGKADSYQVKEETLASSFTQDMKQPVIQKG